MEIVNTKLAPMESLVMVHEYRINLTQIKHFVQVSRTAFLLRKNCSTSSKMLLHQEKLTLKNNCDNELTSVYIIVC